MLAATELTRDGAFPWRDLLVAHGFLHDVVDGLVGTEVFEDSRWGFRRRADAARRAALVGRPLLPLRVPLRGELALPARHPAARRDRPRLRRSIPLRPRPVRPAPARGAPSSADRGARGRLRVVARRPGDRDARGAGGRAPPCIGALVALRALLLRARTRRSSPRLPTDVALPRRRRRPGRRLVGVPSRASARSTTSSSAIARSSPATGSRAGSRSRVAPTAFEVVAPVVLVLAAFAFFVARTRLRRPLALQDWAMLARRR